MLNTKQTMSEIFELDEYQRHDISKIIMRESNLLKAMYELDKSFSQARAPYPFRIFKKLYRLMIGILIEDTQQQYQNGAIDDDELNEQLDILEQ